MKVSLTLSDFPMRYLNKMIVELARYLDGIDVQVGGEDTVYVNFATTDIVKVQQVSILCDRYSFGGKEDDGTLLYGDEEQEGFFLNRPVQQGKTV